MKRLMIITIMIMGVFFYGTAWSGPDQYIGDTAIYSGSTVGLKPNVLIVFDNSDTMDDPASGGGDPYYPKDSFVDTFEGSLSGGGFDNTYWTKSALSGTNNWAWSTDQYQSSSHSWYSASEGASSDRVLVMRSLGIRSSGTTNTILSFYHTFRFNTGGGGTCLDGGTLEYSTDGGTTWTVIPDSAFTSGGFNGTVSSASNPINGKRAWCAGSIGAMTQVTVNLSSVVGLGGQIAKIRWHAGDDSTAAKTGIGWYVDSVSITDTAYSGSYDPWTVYKVTGQANYVQHIANTSWALTNVSCAEAKTGLQTYGTWSGSSGNTLKSNGVCGSGGAGLVYIGNLLNYNTSVVTGTTQTQVEIIRQAVSNIVGSLRGTVNFGLMVFDNNKAGGNLLRPVADISSDTAYNNFISVLPGTPSTGASLLSGNGRPLAEALFDAGAYYKGVSNLPISGQLVSASPIQYSCQKNYVVIITNGDTQADQDSNLYNNATTFGVKVADYDSDGADCTGSCTNSADVINYGGIANGSHFLDDVAAFLADNTDPVKTDLRSDLDGNQVVITHAIQVFSPDTVLVRRAADGSHGRGTYTVASSATEVSNALSNVMTNIVLEADTSFVAPVVPVSPENRTFSGSRVYLGFFKPISQKPWLGNLKKFGLNSSLQIIDSTGALATNSDGSFKDTSISFWSSIADGGTVDSGGAGELLALRTTARNIYTYMGTSADLTNTGNAFVTTNTSITATTLSVADSTEKDKLINFVRGIDSYNDDGDASSTENRSWPLGDILHARPLVVNYTSYTFTAANELDCSINKTMIFVGANDGMLHAFKDCNGEEAWAFIPPDILPRLKHLREIDHTYYVDASPIAYIYDANGNGTIETGDKVIMIFGQRRGGGSDTAPTGGFYYALDVSNPLSPQYLWRLSNSETSTADAENAFAELGETWSDPKIVKMKIGTEDKIVAIVGAGYDNLNEDSRYGATQQFLSPANVVDTATGYGNVTTTAGGSYTLVNAPNNPSPKGRGVYIIEVATLVSSVPSFTSSGRKIWGYTYGATTTSTTNSGLLFSISAEVASLDSDYNGYTDRIYVGDTGGNIWRLDVGNTDITQWSGRKLFSANPGDAGTTDVGRKIFYRPSIVIDIGGIIRIFFGTGDREHPLNWAITDRLYSLRDSGQTTLVLENNTTDTAFDLVDVTTDILQASSTDQTTINNTLSSLNSLYGWYIKLNLNTGEKVLSPALVFNKVAYYTTYAPNTTVPPDPCSPGNLGAGRLYATDYKTGEAVLNYYAGNDGSATTNVRATPVQGQVLEREDRVLGIGSGIPSGLVVVVAAGGNAQLLIGCGGSLCSQEAKAGGSIVPLYWRRK